MSALLEQVVDKWSYVCQENHDHRALVSEQEFANWQEFEKGITKHLKSIVQNYDGRELSKEDTDWLLELGDKISSAQRMTKAELEKRKDEEEARRKKREEAAALELQAKQQEEVEVKNFRTSLLQKLKLRK